MNLHILFCPSQSTAPDGTPLPTASLALTLDEETQFRCAGFVQAEIERYAEELDQSSPHDSDDSEAEGSDDQDEGHGRGSAHPKKGGKKKGRQSPKADHGGKFALSSMKFSYRTITDHRVDRVIERTASRERLEKEYVFLGVIAAFLRTRERKMFAFTPKSSTAIFTSPSGLSV